MPPRVHGGITESGDIVADPEFLDGVNLTFPLFSKSPLIDIEDNAGKMTISCHFDLGRTPRTLDGDEDTTEAIDMGINEYVSVIY